MDNEATRKKFIKWHTDNFKPSLKMISEYLEISEPYFSQWKNGKRNMSDELLKKIDTFMKDFNFYH